MCSGCDGIELAVHSLGLLMAVHILICDCGMRVKAPGATPGRVGRCPKCGRRLQVPEQAETFRLKPDEDEPPRAKAKPDGAQTPVSPGEPIHPQPFRLKPDNDKPLAGAPGAARQRAKSGSEIPSQPFRLKRDSDQPPTTEPDDTGGPAASIYQLLPEERASRQPPNHAPAIEDSGPRPMSAKALDFGPMADGLLRVPKAPESNWCASFLYPLRSIECLSVIGLLSGVFWSFLILVPEYCLSIMGDADSMGMPTMGKFLALISILPVAFLLPLVLLYWVQYLGRVLVFSAMGDTVPPRTPDRNFDGFFSGLSPWFVWVALGGSVGSLPLVVYGFYQHFAALEWSWPLALLLFLLGFPYVVMALLISFLHDHALAANPLNVTSAMLRLGSSFFLLCAFALGTLALGAAAFALVLWLRPSHFAIYIVLCLVCLIVVEWCLIVIMRVLGTYYYRRRELLEWHHERPRWGVAWKV